MVETANHMDFRNEFKSNSIRQSLVRKDNSILMATPHNIFIDPETNESVLDIIRDTTGDIRAKDWLNRFCRDSKTQVLA